MGLQIGVYATISEARRNRLNLDTIDQLDWILYQEIADGFQIQWSKVSKPETDTSRYSLILNVERFKDRGTVAKNKKSIVYYPHNWVVESGAFHQAVKKFLELSDHFRSNPIFTEWVAKQPVPLGWSPPDKPFGTANYRPSSRSRSKSVDFIPGTSTEFNPTSPAGRVAASNRNIVNMEQADSSHSNNNGKSRVPPNESFDFAQEGYEISNNALAKMFQDNLKKLHDSVANQFVTMNTRMTAIEKNQQAQPTTQQTSLNASSSNAGRFPINTDANDPISHLDDIGGSGVDLGPDLSQSSSIYVKSPWKQEEIGYFYPEATDREITGLDGLVQNGSQNFFRDTFLFIENVRNAVAFRGEDFIRT